TVAQLNQGIGFSMVVSESHVFRCLIAASDKVIVDISFCASNAEAQPPQLLTVHPNEVAGG
ncbi:MAG: hypothetical protein NUW21_15975, partial [Elusimicrobia bacterium]|nr:hypothetical protein [Elusimicrobiota bacterium]